MSTRRTRILGLSYVAAGLVGLSGCVGTYNDVVDPCYPERWNCRARGEVADVLQTQANNGLALEQTLYNHYFAEGSDELLPGGKALLVRLARRRPTPEPAIFVQAANDGDILQSRNLDEIAQKRKDLNERRVKAVSAFLKAIRPDVNFTVAVHDPSPVGMDAIEAARATYDMHMSAIGNMPLQGPGGVSSSSSSSSTSSTGGTSMPSGAGR